MVKLEQELSTPNSDVVETNYIRRATWQNKIKPQIDQLFEQHLQQHGAFLTEQIQAANAQAMAQMGGQQQSGAATQEEVQSDQFATPDEGIQQGGPM